MTKIILFIPYFGRLPSNFNLWLISCSFNKGFIFYVFTDDRRQFDLPENVKIINLDLKDFSKLVSDRFNLDVVFKNPYKLCDLKPFYGYIFDNYLDGCDYWGYCDIDLVFGNLSYYLPHDLHKYDKIGRLGHFCLIRNDKITNEFFKLPVNSVIKYKDVICSDIHFGFDEIGDYGVNSIFEENHLTIFPYEEHIADITSKNEGMVISQFKNGRFYHIHGKRLFSFEKGRIFSNTLSGSKIIRTEYAYVHFQKRKMRQNSIGKATDFIICHHSFEKYREITSDYIKKNQPFFKINLPRLFRLKIKGLKTKHRRNKYISKKIFYEK